MSRYIDADALSRYLTDDWGYIVVADEINNAPSIDIEDYVPKDYHEKVCVALYEKHRKEVEALERKRGEWAEDGIAGWRCSSCGEWSNANYSFCPNCGADMRGESDD